MKIITLPSAKTESEDPAHAPPPPVLAPIAIEVSEDLIPFVEDSGEGAKFINELVPWVRDGFHHELGVRLPGFRVRGDTDRLPPGTFVLLLHETPVLHGAVNPNELLVRASLDRLRSLSVEARAATHPINGAACGWVSVDDKDAIEQAGLTSWDAGECIILQIVPTLRRRIAEFMGIQEVANLVEQVREGFPDLTAATVPGAVTLVGLAEVYRCLLEEGISVRDSRTIFESIARSSESERSTGELTARVREALAPQITATYRTDQNPIFAYRLAPQLEAALGAELQRARSGGRLRRESPACMDLLRAVSATLADARPCEGEPVLLAAPDIRRWVRKILEVRFPKLSVVSPYELVPEAPLEILGTIDAHDASPTLQ